MLLKIVPFVIILVVGYSTARWVLRREPPDSVYRQRFAVAVLHEETPVCGGAIVSKKFILSPCYRCLVSKRDGIIPASKLVMVYSFFGVERYTQGVRYTHRVERTILHPDCEHKHVRAQIPENNIGVLKLKKRVRLAEDYYAKIPKYIPVYLHDRFMYTQYAVDRVSTSLLNSTWSIYTRVVDPYMCKGIYSCPNTYKDLFCTEYIHEDGKNNCTYDVGMVLSVRENMTDWTQDRFVAILDHKKGCGLTRPYAAAIRLPRHIPWLVENAEYIDRW